MDQCRQISGNLNPDRTHKSVYGPLHARGLSESRQTYTRTWLVAAPSIAILGGLGRTLRSRKEPCIRGSWCGVTRSGMTSTPDTQTVQARPSSLRVAVIGAGAAGLVSARELLREGHCVTIFEQGSEVGGVWLYDPKVEDDPLGLNSTNASKVHTSMYASLRTNLTREVMSFLDFPFRPPPGSDDARRYPHHEAVAHYLQYFAEFYHLRPLIRFGTAVLSVLPLPLKYIPPTHQSQGGGEGWTQWELESCSTEDVKDVDCFHAVVVANGHYSHPKLADIEGASLWPGHQLHSHNYRHPGPFTGLHVAVIGGGSSGEDISREIAQVAASVHRCSRGWGTQDCPSTPEGNVWRHPMLDSLSPSGEAVFEDGSRTLIHVLLHCTGYRYTLPFLRGLESSCLSVEGQRVGPLYDHIFPPSMAPTLAFVGLPWQVAPFPLCQLQAKWIARVLAGKGRLPSEVEMGRAVEEQYERMEQEGISPRYTHRMGGQMQWEYLAHLAGMCGVGGVEEWRESMYNITTATKRFHPESYRDEFPDPELVAKAQLAQAHLPLRVREE